MYLFNHSSVPHSFVHSFFHTLNSFIYSFIHSLIPSYIHSFIHFFTHSLTHSFLPSITQIALAISIQGLTLVFPSHVVLGCSSSFQDGSLGKVQSHEWKQLNILCNSPDNWWISGSAFPHSQVFPLGFNFFWGGGSDLPEVLRCLLTILSQPDLWLKVRVQGVAMLRLVLLWIAGATSRGAGGPAPFKDKCLAPVWPLWPLS